MICLLILLERGRCWLWDTRNPSNTSRPIWVYKYVFMHMYVISVTSEAIVVFKQPLRSMFTMNLSCITELPAYSDSVWTAKKCHCKRNVTVTGIFSIRSSFFGPKNCHCSRNVTVTGVTVSGDACSTLTV